MLTASSGWTFWELLHFIGPKIVFSIICGGLIGIERERKHKPAGIKTNILICLGSALYSSLSILMSEKNLALGGLGDPARVAAQIVTGIGFLGGGTIIQSRGTIIGLTTAATIWLVAAIGMLIGIGYADVAIFSALVVVTILVVIGWFERKVLGRSQFFKCEVLADDPQGTVRLAINTSLMQNNLDLDHLSINVNAEGQNALICIYRGHPFDHKKFVLDLWCTPGIREVKQL